jgi:hypothetical protein
MKTPFLTRSGGQTVRYRAARRGMFRRAPSERDAAEASRTVRQRHDPDRFMVVFCIKFGLQFLSAAFCGSKRFLRFSAQKIFLLAWNLTELYQIGYNRSGEVRFYN